MIQLSHLCMATGENMAFTSQTFVRKVMSLLLKTLSRFDIALSSTCHYLSTICLLIYHLSIYVSICVSIIVNLSIDHLFRYLSFCVSFSVYLFMYIFFYLLLFLPFAKVIINLYMIIFTKSSTFLKIFSVRPNDNESGQSK